MMTESFGRAYSPPELLCEFLVNSYILKMEWELLWTACKIVEQSVNTVYKT